MAVGREIGGATVSRCFVSGAVRNEELDGAELSSVVVSMVKTSGALAVSIFSSVNNKISSGCLAL